MRAQDCLLFVRPPVGCDGVVGAKVRLGELYPGKGMLLWVTANCTQIGS